MKNIWSNKKKTKIVANFWKSQNDMEATSKYIVLKYTIFCTTVSWNKYLNVGADLWWKTDEHWPY